jgi:long-subunit acyl-CoA synthetase (AMP-forming)
MTASVPFGPMRRDLRGCISLYDGRTVRDVPFATLAEDVDRACARLVTAGLARGACVGILGENCYEWLVYDLALMTLGCILVGLPVEEFAARPPETLARSYDLSLLLVTAKVGNQGHLPWVLVMNDPNAPEARVRPCAEGELLEIVRRTDACTVIFSSGTSGQLKALVLSRKGVDVCVDSLANDWEMSPNDSILLALPLSIFQQRVMLYAALRKDTKVLFTSSANLMRSLAALRASIVLGPPALFESIERRFDALPRLRNFLLRTTSRLAQLIPSRGLRAALRRRLFRGAHAAFGGRVRVLLTGSAPSKLSTLAFYERAGLPLFQVYGMAEVGFIAWNRPGRNRPPSVGRPIIPGSVIIADGGEIVISVPHRQTISYLGVPQAEASRTFLPDGRVATGDVGYLDRQGYLHITGRKKNVIVLASGEKVHPESLEQELAVIPGIDRVVVLGGEDLPGLVALVAIDPATSAQDEAKLSAAVRGAMERLNATRSPPTRLTRFLITRQPFNVETGLVTRNLKVDRRAVQRRFASELEHPAAGSMERSAS